MAIHVAFVMMTLTLGNCLRTDPPHEHSGLLESASNVTVTGRKCCCYRPVGSKVYTNPWKGNCPVKPGRGCASPGKPSPCEPKKADKYDMYCEWYYILDCNSMFRNAENIMWNTAWESDYEHM